MDERNGDSYAGDAVDPYDFREDAKDEAADQDDKMSNQEVEDFPEDDPATVHDGDDTKVQLPAGGY